MSTQRSRLIRDFLVHQLSGRLDASETIFTRTISSSCINPSGVCLHACSCHFVLVIWNKFNCTVWWGLKQQLKPIKKLISQKAEKMWPWACAIWIMYYERENAAIYVEQNIIHNASVSLFLLNANIVFGSLCSIFQHKISNKTKNSCKELKHSPPSLNEATTTRRTLMNHTPRTEQVHITMCISVSL